MVLKDEIFCSGVQDLKDRLNAETTGVLTSNLGKLYFASSHTEQHITVYVLAFFFSFSSFYPINKQC